QGKRFVLVRSRITRRDILRQTGLTSAIALGPSALALTAGMQNQPAPPPTSGAQPKPESQAAENYPHPPGVFINRPLTQVSKAAEALLDDMEGRNCDFFWNEASPNTGLIRDRALWR